jgi:hypothetical protein
MLQKRIFLELYRCKKAYDLERAGAEQIVPLYRTLELSARG